MTVLLTPPTSTATAPAVDWSAVPLVVAMPPGRLVSTARLWLYAAVSAVPPLTGLVWLVA